MGEDNHNLKKTGRGRRPIRLRMVLYGYGRSLYGIVPSGHGRAVVFGQKKSAPALSGCHNPASCAESFWKKRDTIDSRRCADALLSAAAPPPCRTLRITTGEREWEE